MRIAELDKEQKVGEQTAGVRARRAGQGRRADDAHCRWPTPTPRPSPAKTEPQADDRRRRRPSLQVKKAEAYQLGETRKREAEAAVQEAQNRAMAKAALAEAERVEAERRAAVEAPAKAEKAKIDRRGRGRGREARASRPRARRQAIFAKLEAEARGQYEILAKKGEGLQQIIEACGGAKQAFQMLMLEHLDKLAETSAKAISNIKFDKVVVWENGGTQRQEQHGQLPAQHGPHACRR